jgi:hypothetical protein
MQEGWRLFRRGWRRSKGREKFLSAKIQRKPLKRLDSDERIQGNPSFSNPRYAWVSASKRPFQEKPNGLPHWRSAIAKEPNRLPPNAKPHSHARSALCETKAVPSRSAVTFPLRLFRVAGG